MKNFMKSNNPMFNEKNMSKAKVATLDKKRTGGPIYEETAHMTVSGAVNKTLMLVGILLIVTVYSFLNPMSIFMPVGVFGGMAVFFLCSMKPHLAPTLAPLYAILEGLFVGTISYMYAGVMDGIIFQAVSLTIGTLMAMLMVHKSGIIPVTKGFRTAVTMAVGAIMIVYLLSWIGSYAGFTIPYIHEGGPIGIGITVVIIGVAALNLLLDFDNFEKGEQNQLAQHYEWYFGMGLLFTIIWLYVEFLRLLSKLQSD